VRLNFLAYCKLVFKKIKMYFWFRRRGLPQASVLEESSLFKVYPRKNPMSAQEFTQLLSKLAKPTREFKVSQDSEKPLPVTKVAGEPWWPAGMSRPKCRHGHSMAFVAQILLSDVPLSDMPANALLSFHYCNECTMGGQMSFGFFDDENDGYDLTILYDIDKADADMKGLSTPSITKSYDISFRDIEEVPGGLCEDANIEHENFPEDYPQGKDDFDENVYPGLKHISNSKIGGWPSWVQYPEWPINEARERYIFLGQLDWWLFDGTPWCNGGYVYLFITNKPNSKLKAEMLIQTS
jgi:uncharacterized protein YwqG